MFKNSPQRYGLISKALHWFMLALFLFQWGSILAFRHLEETSYGVEPPALTWAVLNWHKSIGLIILILGIIRLVWRTYTPLPDWPKGFTDWDQSVSHFAEWGLYTCMIGMSVSGICIELWGGHYIPFFDVLYLDNLSPFIHWGEGVHTPELDGARAAGIIAGVRDLFVVVHILGAFLFIALLAVHVSHIVRHQVHLKNQILKRMTKG